MTRRRMSVRSQDRLWNYLSAQLKKEAAIAKLPVCFRCKNHFKPGRWNFQCDACTAKEAARMAGVAGIAAVSIFRCAYLGECEGRKTGECSMQTHHVRSFVKHAWRDAITALDLGFEVNS